MEIVIEVDCMDGTRTAVFRAPEDKAPGLYQKAGDILNEDCTLEAAKMAEQELGIKLMMFYDADDSLIYAASNLMNL